MTATITPLRPTQREPIREAPESDWLDFKPLLRAIEVMLWCAVVAFVGALAWVVFA